MTDESRHTVETWTHGSMPIRYGADYENTGTPIADLESFLSDAKAAGAVGVWFCADRLSTFASTIEFKVKVG